ncbi:hypothetical protein [Jannaschia sp. AI_61]|uniref:hypothetical protein n=1 Tax=Jannaschia sp. AI_61 TaxID=2829796 RepID=UPI001C7CFAD9|nr:hypothetical protein [Jannaschia sp. AI_61]
MIWLLTTNPLAQPFVERTAEDLSQTLERRIARQASPAWIASELDRAIASDDPDRVAMLLSLREDLGHSLDTEAAEALLARHQSLLPQALSCGRCMVDVATCPSLTHLAACAAPFELSPLGDINALRRGAVAWAAGDEVDHLDVSLALIGLGATVAVVASGGSSTAVKAGAGLTRMANRMGTLTPAAKGLLRVPVRWTAVPAYLSGRAALDTVTDLSHVARLGRFAADMDRVRRATSTAEALRLARHVDSPEDAARLARLAEAAGPRTSRSLAVLGKARAFRATLRLTEAAIGALLILWATVLHLAVVLGTRLGALALCTLVRL